MLKRFRLVSAFTVITVLALFHHSEAQTLAFPGAEGFGQYAVGGRGGRVIEVTNLNGSGPGSFRAACEASGARIVVFRVSGTIDLMNNASPMQSDIMIYNDSITIAGQTAPGEGVQIKNGGIFTRAAKHVIIRYLRVRPGPDLYTKYGYQTNGIGTMAGGDLKPGIKSTDVIIDHCSIQWATDDLVFILQGSRRTTVQWCIIGDGLYCGTPVGASECVGKGLLIGSNGSQIIDATIHHNLFANMYNRGPSISLGNIDVVNNVNYNMMGQMIDVNAYYGEIHTNIIGNHHRYGPQSSTLIGGNPAPTTERPTIRILGGLTYSAQSTAFVAGNISRYRPNDTLPEYAAVWSDNGGATRETQRLPFPSVRVTDALTARDEVPAAAGANRPVRDVEDARMVAEAGSPDVSGSDAMGSYMRGSLGSWPDWPNYQVYASATPSADTDHDGMPDFWETSNGLNPNLATDGPLDKDGDGYTNVEEYLNELAGDNDATTAIGFSRPGIDPKPVISQRVKQCPLDIFGRTIGAISKNSKRKNLPREILDRKLGQKK